MTLIKVFFTLIFTLFILNGQAQRQQKDVYFNILYKNNRAVGTISTYFGFGINDQFLKSKLYQKISFNIYTYDGVLSYIFPYALTNVNLGYGLGYKYVYKKLYVDLSTTIGGLYIYGKYGDYGHKHIGAFLLPEFSTGLQYKKWNIGFGYNFGYGFGISNYNYVYLNHSFRVPKFGVSRSLFLRVGFKF